MVDIARSSATGWTNSADAIDGNAATSATDSISAASIGAVLEIALAPTAARLGRIRIEVLASCSTSAVLVESVTLDNATDVSTAAVWGSTDSANPSLLVYDFTLPEWGVTDADVSAGLTLRLQAANTAAKSRTARVHNVVATGTLRGTRDMAAIVANALGDGVIEPFFAIDLEFDSGTLRLWTGNGDRDIDGETYIGAGTFLQVSDLQETAEIQAAGATLTLSGIPSELLSLALTEPYQQRPARIYFGLIADADDMVEVFTARMDQMVIDEGPETSTIQLTVENVLVDLERPRVARYTNADQQSRFPGDRGLEFVESVQGREIFWGRVPK
jgi:hypothetical protein